MHCVYLPGEDRWLCTLLLQQGYRVDYTAASDALTYAPEGFNEFFNQRRRWTPSTMANIIDLLSNSHNTVLMNDNISWFYIFYQLGMLVATVLGPATVILAIATAFETVMSLRKWQSFTMTLLPVAFHLIISFTTKSKTQLLVCAFLTTFYSCVMTVVLVGILEGLASKGILDPSLIFLSVLAVCFVFAGTIHPYEFSCLAYGLLYYLCIPAGYLVLIVYSLSNMNIVTWGTREVPKKKTKAQMEEDAKLEEKKTKKKHWFAFFDTKSMMSELREMIALIFSGKREADDTQTEILRALRTIHKDLKKLSHQMAPGASRVDSDSDVGSDEPTPIHQPEQPQPETITPEPDDPLVPIQKPVTDTTETDSRPVWVEKWAANGSAVEYLDEGETQFWQQLIKKYLKPLKKDVKYEKKMADELIMLRNNVSFAFWLINGLWVLFNYMLQTSESLSVMEVFGLKTQPLGFVFMIFFMFVLVLQLIGMLIHRWGTFLQLIAITELSVWSRRPTAQDLVLNDKRTSKPNTSQVVNTVSEMMKPYSMFDQPGDYRCVSLFFSFLPDTGRGPL